MSLTQTFQVPLYILEATTLINLYTNEKSNFLIFLSYVILLDILSRMLYIICTLSCIHSTYMLMKNQIHWSLLSSILFYIIVQYSTYYTFYYILFIVPHILYSIYGRDIKSHCIVLVNLLLLHRIFALLSGREATKDQTPSSGQDWSNMTHSITKLCNMAFRRILLHSKRIMFYLIDHHNDHWHVTRSLSILSENSFSDWSICLVLPSPISASVFLFLSPSSVSLMESEVPQIQSSPPCMHSI